MESLEDFLVSGARHRMIATTSREVATRLGAAAIRFQAAINDVVGTYENGTGAVAAHGGVTVDLLRGLLGDDQLLTVMPDIINEGGPSCAITTLGFDGSQCRVEKLPSVAHLGASAAVPGS